MILAKCIWEAQIASSPEEFALRQSEKNPVYCEGQTTKSKNGTAILDCVPLSLIYDCLKYGDHIAIIDGPEYVDIVDDGSGCVVGKQISSSAQRVVKIIEANSKEAIDYVFQNVENNKDVHSGYLNWLSEDLQMHFNDKQRR